MTAEREDHLLRLILQEGRAIREWMARAPFFGPHAPPDVEAHAWAELDLARARLRAYVGELAEPEMITHYQLEVEGVGEKLYTATEHLKADQAARRGRGDVEPEQERMELDALFEAELRMFRSRLAALRGEADPAYPSGRG